MTLIFAVEHTHTSAVCVSNLRGRESCPLIVGNPAKG